MRIAGTRRAAARGERRTVAVLLHRRGLLDDPGVVDEVVSAAHLALDNERFGAEVRARIDDLRASRARIVATSDTERRRLERDLHDGAQQRLVELSVAIGLSRTHASDNASLRNVLDEAEQRLRGAIEELRNAAHGIYPAVFSSDGLAAAIGALREHTSVPIVVGAMPRNRCSLASESAAYSVTFDLTGPFATLAHATRASVSADHSLGVLALTVSLEGARRLDSELKARLIDLEDRVGAIDGQMRVRDDEPGTIVVRVEIPCAS
jgi:signal transduction histidine kinase